MKIISLVGARPNFMKIAPFINAIKKHNAQPATRNPVRPVSSGRARPNGCSSGQAELRTLNPEPRTQNSEP